MANLPIESPVVDAARDQLPETWDALLDAETYGEEALARRLNVVLYRTFGVAVDEAMQKAMSPMLAEYTGCLLALEIIVPGIDFWSKQAISLSAGERESKAYKDRAEDLRKLRDDLFRKAASFLPYIEDEMPQIPRRVTDTARVQNAGLLTEHVTADPLIFPPLYGDIPDTGPV